MTRTVVRYGLALSTLLALGTSGCVKRGPRPAPDFAPAQAPGTRARLEATDGFRGVAFGGPVPDGMKLAATQDHPRTQSYVRSNESDRIGRARIREVRYVFYDGALVTVVVEAEGAENGRALLEELWTAYGPSEMPKSAMVHTWRGERVVAFYALSDSGDALVKLWSRPMIARLLRDARLQGGVN